MRKYIGQNRKKYINCMLAIIVTAAMIRYAASESMTAEATSIGQVQQNIDKRQKEIEEILARISSLEDEQDLLQEQIDDLNSEIVNTMAAIGVLEDKIAAKETELVEKQGQIDEKKEQIVDKQEQITATEAEYYAAVEREETQRQNMIDCTRLLYENQDESYLSTVLEGKGLSDILNQMDYVERVYEYSMDRLDSYIESKNQVHDLWDRLELEKAELEEQEAELEEQRSGLEQDRQGLVADRAELKDLEASLDAKLAKKKKESKNFEAEIARAEKEAALAKKLLQQDQQTLKQLQAAQSAAQVTTNTPIATTDYTSVIDNASGSDLGKKIAKYACQYIGNPYVLGGTSLTKGADCSGFTYRIYMNWGYSIPRTSYQQRSAGVGVSYADAQPGDLICYEGHVAMYIGNGMIVHASSTKTGIKVSRAEYQTILAVRRIIQ